MTITFLDLYNEVTGQAWSMFDGEIEDQDEFETAVTLAIQKALAYVWCSYKFPFRERTLTFQTLNGKAEYDTPNGNIFQKTVNKKNVYSVKLDKTFLTYEPDYETLEDTSGTPEKFYVKNTSFCLYPVPDAAYNIEVGYWSIFLAMDEDDEEKATLENDTDYINIPEKYEHHFRNCVISKAMIYIIADESDENHSGYQTQYDEAYKILIDLTAGIDKDKRIGWRQ